MPIAEFAAELGPPVTEKADEQRGRPTAAESSTALTPRYPKRDIELKNYHEDSDEETDPANFCFCECCTTFSLCVCNKCRENSRLMD